MNASGKIVSVSLLAALLAASVLTSCGSETAKNPVSAGNNTPDNAAESETAEPSYLDRFAGTDFGGAEYKIATLSSEWYPNYTGDQTNGEPVNDAQFKRDKWIEEQYNMTISYEVFTGDGKQHDALSQRIQAGDAECDFIEGNMTYVLCPLSASGMLLDLKSTGLDLDADWWSQSMNSAFTINNHLFTTTGPIAFTYYYAPRVVAFNLRLAEDYNIGDLYSIVDAGKWTLDCMAGYMKDFTTDLDGDGKIGEDDLWAASVDEYSAAGFYISAGGTQTAIGSDGKPYFVLEDQRNVDIAEKVASIIGNADMTQKAEELAYRSGGYNTLDKVYTFKNGNALFFGYGAQAIAVYLRDMQDDYGIIPVPKYDEAQKDYITFGNAFVPAYIGIPTTNDRGTMNSIVLDTMGFISRRDVQPLVSDITLKGKAARDEASQRMLDIIYKDIYLDFNASYNIGDTFNFLREYTMGNEKNYASGMKKVLNKANEELDNLYEQYLAIDE